MKLSKKENNIENGSISSISLDSTRSNTTGSSLNGKIIRLKNTSKNFIFPMIYFLTSTLFLFILLFVNIYKENETKNSFKKLPMHPFPSLSSSKKIYRNIFSVSIILISISGILNIWFFCSLLLQRFSVPELNSNKLTVHLMFILGIFANLIYLFFGFSTEILKFEHSKIKILRISISMIIFLSFIFFNLLFASLTLNVLLNFKKQIAHSDKRLTRDIKGKKYLVCVTVFLLLLYIFAIYIRYNMAMHINDKAKHNKNSKMKSNFNSEDEVKDSFGEEKQVKIKEENPGHGYLSNLNNNNNNINNRRNSIANYEANKKNYFKNKFFSDLEKSLLKIFKSFIDAILFLFPYLLFFFNSLINLSYYFDIAYFEDIINIIVDREFFLSNEESTNIFTEFPI